MMKDMNTMPHFTAIFSKAYISIIFFANDTWIIPKKNASAIAFLDLIESEWVPTFQIHLCKMELYQTQYIPKKTYHGNKMPVFIIRAGAPDVAQKNRTNSTTTSSLRRMNFGTEGAGTKSGTC